MAEKAGSCGMGVLMFREKIRKDGDFCVYRLFVGCPRCGVVTIVVPNRRDQEIDCILCGLVLGVVDGAVVIMGEASS